MFTYIIKRLLLIIPTLLGIMLINFMLIQTAPGGPAEQLIGQLQGIQVSNNLQSLQSDIISSSGNRSTSGLDQDIISNINKMYGFDKPAHERFFELIYNYLSFDFGRSLFSDKSVLYLIAEKLPVSISLGLWTTLISYLIAIPLGIHKAVKDGQSFDLWSSSIIAVLYATPNFLFAILLIVIFAGGSYLDWFPLHGLTSSNFSELGLWAQIKDYIWHISLPVLASVIGSFAALSLLTKNSFLDEINKAYVLTARAKGLNERQVLYGHVFRNAMLIIIAGLPSALIGIFFSSSLLIEVMFSLDGLGLLGYEAVIKRDYPVIFASLYIFTLVGLLLKIISDLIYRWVDPRIDFESKEH